MRELGCRDTKTAILDTAEEMLQRRSFNSFSYSHISEQLGLRKASVHYHFASKSDLGVALIERYRERFQHWCEELRAAELSARCRIEAYVARYRDVLEEDKICPGGVLCTEYNTIDPPMQMALRELVHSHHEWLAATLEQGRRAGELAFRGEATDQAALLSATLQGAVQQGRVLGLPGFLAALKQLLRSMDVSARDSESAALLGEAL